MKTFRIAIFAAVPYLLNACRSEPTSPATSTSHAVIGGLQKLEGTWVGHEQGGFTLVKIKADSTGSYTKFTDREKYTGQSFPTDRYFLYESDIKVTYKLNRHPDVAIYTDNFRFDYLLRGDTLIEYDKMGQQGILVRVKTSKH